MFWLSLSWSENGISEAHEALVKENVLSLKLSLYVEMMLIADGVKTAIFQLVLEKTLTDSSGVLGEFLVRMMQIGFYERF